MKQLGIRNVRVDILYEKSLSESETNESSEMFLFSKSHNSKLMFFVIKKITELTISLRKIYFVLSQFIDIDLMESISRPCNNIH